ncbi:hypothetical protein [Amycolatopsis sp. lyj-23]|uniref:hypothetical protein n=1 Tax=Amycolatopsis sp. lyj-23 TaxID=2789283 RepID=UPI003979D5AD
MISSIRAAACTSRQRTATNTPASTAAALSAIMPIGVSTTAMASGVISNAASGHHCTLWAGMPGPVEEPAEQGRVAHTCRPRILCHTCGHGKDQQMMVPGWPYSVAVALESRWGS